LNIDEGEVQELFRNMMDLVDAIKTFFSIKELERAIQKVNYLVGESNCYKISLI
jgi:hypothetical protein